MEKDELTKVAIVASSGREIRRAVASALANKVAEEFAKPPEIPADMKASPTMQVRFANGEIVALNRRERRRLHLYGDRLKRRQSHRS